MLCLATNSTTGERFSDVLDRAFTEAAIGFFHDAKPVEVRVGDPEFLYGQTWASVLGFTSSDVRGSLVVNLSLGALVGSMPAEIAPCYSNDPADPLYARMLNDWCGEIANQIAGRAKNRIHRYGPLVSLSTPISLMATGMLWGAAPSSQMVRNFFETNTGRASCIASLTLEKDHFVEEIAGQQSPEEGEMMLF